MLTLEWKQFSVNLKRMERVLTQALSNFDGMAAGPDNLTILFKSEPSQGDLDTVNDYWNSLTEQGEATPTVDELQEYIKASIRSAKIFGLSLIEKFSAENVAQGITQANKTSAVAIYLHRLDHYLSTGSLYAAIAEIDRLIGEGLDESLVPFVTEERLLSYKTAIVAYLGL